MHLFNSFIDGSDTVIRGATVSGLVRIDGHEVLRDGVDTPGCDPWYDMTVQLFHAHPSNNYDAPILATYDLLTDGSTWSMIDLERTAFDGHTVQIHRIISVGYRLPSVLTANSEWRQRYHLTKNDQAVIAKAISDFIAGL